MNVDNATDFESFGFEYISKQIKKYIGNKKITKNIHRIQANDMWIYVDTFALDLLTLCKKVKVS